MKTIAGFLIAAAIALTAGTASADRMHGSSSDEQPASRGGNVWVPGQRDANTGGWAGGHYERARSRAHYNRHNRRMRGDQFDDQGTWGQPPSDQGDDSYGRGDQRGYDANDARDGGDQRDQGGYRDGGDQRQGGDGGDQRDQGGYRDGGAGRHRAGQGSNGWSGGRGRRNGQGRGRGGW